MLNFYSNKINQSLLDFQIITENTAPKSLCKLHFVEVEYLGFFSFLVFCGLVA
ncbi:MAG: hypothetical protein RL285_1905 [Bacteroidota bacterium]